MCIVIGVSDSPAHKYCIYSFAAIPLDSSICSDPVSVCLSTKVLSHAPHLSTPSQCMINARSGFSIERQSCMGMKLKMNGHHCEVPSPKIDLEQQSQDTYGHYSEAIYLRQLICL